MPHSGQEEPLRTDTEGSIVPILEPGDALLQLLTTKEDCREILETLYIGRVEVLNEVAGE